MSTKYSARIINMILRGMTLLCKFCLLFFIAKFLEPSQLGLYGLVVVTIGYAIYFLGFDFYTYTTREILKRERNEWGGLLKAQGALTGLLYMVFIPLCGLVFVYEFLPWHISGWFFCLLVLEHLNQELGRLLVAVSEQLTASVVLFLRSGLWAIVVTALMYIEPNTRNLDYVLGAWSVGGLCAFLIGILKLSTMGMSGWEKRVDWGWILNGCKVAIPLLISTFALRGVFTVDRYWFEALSSLEVLGAYVLFMGISSAMMSFLDAGVFAFSYPGLISAFNKQDMELFNTGLRKLLIQTVVLTITFVIVSLLIIDPVLLWLDKAIFIKYIYLFPWVLLSTLLYSFGMIPHFALYAAGQDRPIIYSHIVGFVIFIVAVWMFSGYLPVLAVPYALCIAFASILLFKTWAFYSLKLPVFNKL